MNMQRILTKIKYRGQIQICQHNIVHQDSVIIIRTHVVNKVFQ